MELVNGEFNVGFMNGGNDVEEGSRSGEVRSRWNPSGALRVGGTYSSASPLRVSSPVPDAFIAVDVDSSARTKRGSTAARHAGRLNAG